MVAASSTFERCSGIWSKSRHATAMSVQDRAIHCSTILIGVYFSEHPCFARCKHIDEERHPNKEK